MKKGIILLLYAVALIFVLKNYYKTESGLPKPSNIAAPSYLYGILALSADFLEGFPVVIAAALTVSLIWQSQSTSKVVAKSQPKTQTG